MRLVDNEYTILGASRITDYIEPVFPWPVFPSRSPIVLHETGQLIRTSARTLDRRGPPDPPAQVRPRGRPT